MKLLAAGYEGSASIEHWGSPWLMLEGSRQLVELLSDGEGSYRISAGGKDNEQEVAVADNWSGGEFGLSVRLREISSTEAARCE